MEPEIIGVDPGRGGLHLAALRLGGSDFLVSISDTGMRVWDPRTRKQVTEGRDDYPGVNGVAVPKR